MKGGGGAGGGCAVSGCAAGPRGGGTVVAGLEIAAGEGGEREQKAATAAKGALNEAGCRGTRVAGPRGAACSEN